ncbi:MAG: hypothetical protein KF851_18990 [Pirellulaceae bacterium]|nr:hypothetical protein [Pirellulaceae bacterium]
MSNKFVGWAVALVCLFIAQTTIGQGVINERAEMGKIVDWIKRNNAFGIDHAIVSDMQSLIEEETENGFNINLYFGKELLKGDKYQSVHLWSGQFLSFELSEAQAQSRELKPSSVQTITGKRSDRRGDRQLYEISDLKLNLNSAGKLYGGDKITGTVKVRALGNSTSDNPIAVRLSYRTDVNTSGFSYPNDVQITANGSTLEFSFSPVNDDHNAAEFIGALPIFVDVCHVNQSSVDLDVELLSNSLGAMVMVESTPVGQPMTTQPPVFDTKPARAIDELAERQKAIDWVKRNNKWGIDHAIVSDMAEVINEETEKGFNINIYLGKGLLNIEKFQSIHLWSGQFFQFEMTDFQARSRELGPMSVETSTGKRQDQRSPEPLFELSELTLTNLTGKSLDGKQKVTGTVQVRALGKMDAGKEYALRLGFRTKNNVMRFTYLKAEHFSEKGATVEFSFDEVNDRDDGEPFSGAIPMFFDICTVDSKPGQNVVDIRLCSNSLAVLITVID